MCLLALSFVIFGCKDKYAEAKKLNLEYVSLVQEYIDELDKAESAQDVAKAMDKFAEGQADIFPKMVELAEKYPELKDRKNPPEELKESQKEAEEMGKKMVGTMVKIMPYMKDPEVREAQKRLQEAMMKNLPAKK